MHKRIISLILSVFLTLSFVGCNYHPTESTGNIKGSAEVERTYTTLYANNEALLNQNPNRGFRGYIEVYKYGSTKEEIYSAIDEWMDRHINYASTQVAVCYILMHEYRGKELDDRFFETFQYVFDWAKEHNIQYNLRFVYYVMGYGMGDRTPTTDEILPHIDQIAENGILERNKNQINVLQAGFVGQFGEWHSETTPADRDKVLTAINEKLLPEGVWGQVRKPAYRDHLSDEESKNLYGYHMDSFFGIQDSSQFGSGDFSPGLADWDRAMKEGAYTPNDGEMYFHGDLKNYYGFFPNGYSCLLGMSQLRMTTFGSENGYLQVGVFGDSAMHRWQALPLTEKWLNENGIPYSENWFKNPDGETIERNVFEYIRDYLGYRLTATKLVTKQNDGKLNISLDLENHGFSAAFNITSSLVIMDKDGNVISEAAAGDPTSWHSTNPDNYKDRKQLVHNISADIELPSASGEYSLGLKLVSKNGATARLDNNIPYENGVNMLHSFEVK